MNESHIVEILLVEDSLEDLEMTRRALRNINLGNSMHVARDGAEALDFIFCEGEFADRQIEDTPKLILLDLKLPKVDGLEVLRQLKQHPALRVIPVVVLTTSGESADVQTAYQLGVNSYIVKPVEFEKFMDVSEKLDLYWTVVNQRPY